MENLRENLKGESKRPQQPLVYVSGYQAEALCKAQGKRLATPLEWEYAAGGPNHFRYSTRDGKVDAVAIYKGSGDESFTRDVGAGAGHYVQWGADELFDMNGNAEEWTYDPKSNEYCLSGRWLNKSDLVDMSVDAHFFFEPDDETFTSGVRCASSLQDS